MMTIDKLIDLRDRAAVAALGGSCADPNMTKSSTVAGWALECANELAWLLYPDIAELCELEIEKPE